MSQILSKFIASSVDASKIGAGLVSNTEFGYLDGVTSAIQTQLGNKISSSEKGANNGVATLDAGGKVPAAQLPNTVMEFQGQYNATTNSPVLIDGTGNAGDVYRVEVAGTQDFGAGSQIFSIGDWIMYSGSVWQKASNSNLVTSVNSQQGVVVLTTSDITEGTNLYFTDEKAQDAIGLMVANSSKVSLTYVDGTPSLTADIVSASLVNADISASAAIDATKIGGGLVSNTEFNYLDGVTSAIQTQLNALAVAIPKKETFTLSAGDITNQYIDFLQVAKVDSIHFVIKGGAPTLEGASHDYSVSYTGGAGGKTRVSFLNDLATAGAAALVAGDIVQMVYSY